MTRKFTYNSEDEDKDTTFVRIKAKRHVAVSSDPKKKASYEASADVQRWLKEQAVEDSVVKPPFNPTFLVSRRDGPWLLSSLTQFYEEDLITDVLYTVKSGKEASVYCCAAHPSTGVQYLAAKIYRPRMFRSLKNDAIYRHGRVQRDEASVGKGQPLRGGRGRRGRVRKNEHGRSVQVSSWISYEFETQRRLYNAGANVPEPLSQIGNAVLMEYIGDAHEPAPLLHDVSLEREEAQSLYENVMHNIELALANRRIHGDLSEYNMLYWQGAVVLIDFAQAVDTDYDPAAAFSLLARDIERVCRYFARYGVQSEPSELAASLWSSYMGPLT